MVNVSKFGIRVKNPFVSIWVMVVVYPPLQLMKRVISLLPLLGYSLAIRSSAHP